MTVFYFTISNSELAQLINCSSVGTKTIETVQPINESGEYDTIHPFDIVHTDFWGNLIFSDYSNKYRTALVGKVGTVKEITEDNKHYFSFTLKNKAEAYIITL